jgi:putative transposase
VHIESIYWRSRRSYGSTRIQHDLCAVGLRCSPKGVARLMPSRNLVAPRRRKYRVTTQSGHRLPVAPNVVGRTFGVAAVQRPNRVWAGEITYIPTREDWLYLSMLLDLQSRRVIGTRLHSRPMQELALDPLEQALHARRLSTGLSAHSDRGTQYASKAYQELLQIVCSMSREGDCWGNAVVESFFSTLKCELVHDADRYSRRGLSAKARRGSTSGTSGGDVTRAWATSTLPTSNYATSSGLRSNHLSTEPGEAQSVCNLARVMDL